MVTLSKIYTRGGDKGQTSLSDGSRRSKMDPLIESYGAVDETNAAVGLVRLHTSGEADEMLGRIQNDLFDLGADLATPHAESYKWEPLRIVQAQVDRLEQEIDQMNERLEPLKSFILPGGTCCNPSSSCPDALPPGRTPDVACCRTGRGERSRNEVCEPPVRPSVRDGSHPQQ